MQYGSQATGLGQASIMRSSRPVDSPGGPEALCSKQPAVGAAVGRLNTNVDLLAGLVDELERRLESVLRNEPMPPPMKDEHTLDGAVPLSQAITASATIVGKLAERLGSMLNRLEV